MLQLETYPRRSFLPEGFDPADAESAERLMKELEERPLPSLADLEQWIRDADELLTAIEEEQRKRHIATTQNTNDPETRAAMEEFLRTMEPLVRERSFRLDERFFSCPFRHELDPDVYGELLEAIETRRRIFRLENVPLLVEEKHASADYRRALGTTLVEFDGAEFPLPRMRIHQYHPDRAHRERAWRAVSERLLRDRDTYEDLFDRIFRIRTKIAHNADFPDYRAYRFTEWRRCYTPEDCLGFHRAVERHVLPLHADRLERRRRAMGVDALCPWDLTVDPLGRQPVRPFRTGEELVDLTRRIIGRVDPLFERCIASMAEAGLLDLESRPGKGPGGYMCNLPERRLPFIFMNAAGVQDDVRTMLHEGGHAVHVFETRSLEPSFNRGAPMEFAEVASIAMEHMGFENLQGLYEDDDLRRVRLEHLESKLRLFCWVSTIDTFQLELYPLTEHTRDERAELWLRCYRRFRGSVRMEGLEEAERFRWHLQSHLFNHAFYYIDYALAELGALQVWRNYRRDPEAAVEAYRRALSLGRSRPLPELFEAAGARFDLGEELMAELMGEISAEIERLESE